MGLNWDTTLALRFPGSRRPSRWSRTSRPSGVTALPISASGGSTFSGPAPVPPVGGTLATFSADSSDVAGNFTATVDWGDGSSTAGTVGGSGGSFTVTGTHAYAAGGHLPDHGDDRPHLEHAEPRDRDRHRRDHRSPVAGRHRQPVGQRQLGRSVLRIGRSRRPADVGALRVRAGLEVLQAPAPPARSTTSRRRTSPLGRTSRATRCRRRPSGLVPNALYHVRLVATNSAGTTNRPRHDVHDLEGASPGATVAGQVVHGLSNRTGADRDQRQVRADNRAQQDPQRRAHQRAAWHADAEHRRVGGTQHAALAAKKSKKPKKPQTQTGKFGGAVFKVTQDHSGQATLALVEGAKFKGAPTYASCTTKRAKPRRRSVEARPCSCYTPAPTASSAPRAATARRRSAARSGRSPTAATARSSTRSRTPSPSTTSSCTRRSRCTRATATWRWRIPPKVKKKKTHK